MQMERKPSSSNTLEVGYQLHWYMIRSVLGQGAFGITYLAEDVNLHRQVAIKEFYPRQYVVRDSQNRVQASSADFNEKFKSDLGRFIEEARILDQFKHPNIVSVLNIFEANNSAYMVMSYEHGVSLKEILLRQHFLDETDLLNILFPVLDGLERIHANAYIHRDIKPGNIFIRSDGSPVLLDFGSARHAFERQKENLTSLVSPGYAPIEQYVRNNDNQGPWSDIYGMAATLYRAVTGILPKDAISRGESITGKQHDNLIPCRELSDGRYSEGFLNAIDSGLAFLSRDRPQSIAKWKAQFTSPTDQGNVIAFKPGTPIPGSVVSLVQDTLTQTRSQISSQLNGTTSQKPKTLGAAIKRGFQVVATGFGLFAIIFIAINFQTIQEQINPSLFKQENNLDQTAISEPAVLEAPEIKVQEPIVQELVIPKAQVEQPVLEDVIEKEPVLEEPTLQKSLESLNIDLDTGSELVKEGELESVESPVVENQIEQEALGLTNDQLIEQSLPQMLDIETAKELEAQGKIIIIDDYGNQILSN